MFARGLKDFKFQTLLPMYFSLRRMPLDGVRVQRPATVGDEAARALRVCAVRALRQPFINEHGKYPPHHIELPRASTK